MITVEDVEEEVNITRGLTIKKCWLKNRWCPKAKPSTYPNVECSARAYLLYLLLCTLFADKSGLRISIALLKLLENLDEVGSYAWGAVALAYLYRHLGSAIRVEVSQIAGYLTLLKGWVYEHFKFRLAMPNVKYIDNIQPFVCKWIQKCVTVANVHKLASIRRTLDRLRLSEVSWDPYAEVRPDGIVQPVALYSGTIKYMDIVESYHSERFLRQLGHVESIPAPPYRPLEAVRGSSAQKYSVKYGFQPENWCNGPFSKWTATKANAGPQPGLPVPAVSHMPSHPPFNHY